MILTLPGAAALSDFRLEKHLTALQGVLANCIGLSAQFMHLAELSESLDDDEAAILDRLLHYGESFAAASTNAPVLALLSVPRLGTITPWSTKATDIAHHCGLSKVLRLERGIRWTLYFDPAVDADTAIEAAKKALIDEMTEALLPADADLSQIFTHAEPQPFAIIDILGGGEAALKQANSEFGFALSDEEQAYLVQQFTALGRNPTDAELMMFAQVNSEHCRHKIFNADWTVDGEAKSRSPFKMIKETHKRHQEKHGDATLSAYHDNAAVLKGATAARYFPDPASGVYQFHEEPIAISIKVETHNHPTAISPFPGAATGSGGEIRDEGATGRGGKPKAGLTGFSVSHLRIPALPRRWEQGGNAENRPGRIASPLQIMLEGPIGGAAFNNEFGRPNICGYFRTFEHTPAQNQAAQNQKRGYHKPIMLAGGLGNIREQHIEKNPYPPGSLLIVLGGPAMLIGLGGGAASSMATGASDEALDYASVQRGNPEMQRRCQEVIDACWAMGENNPIEWIHDVGAGGLSNALPELVEDAGLAGHFELRDVLNDDPGMSPMQIWCNESQERYVIAIKPENRETFEALCARERALYAIVGTATDDQQLVLSDRHFDAEGGQKPIDLPMETLFGLPPKMDRHAQRAFPSIEALKPPPQPIEELAFDILRFPTVADKTFLVSIGDRSITGLIAQEQMVGRWQVPVADVGVTLSGFHADTGEAMAMGERTPLALLDAPASGRMAIGEAITNIAAACINEISDIRLSANWMVPAGAPGEDANLYNTVHAVAMELCPALGISIPVGKDSMSMQTVWQDGNGDEQAVVAPLSLIISAFAPVADANKTLTPELQLDQGDTELWLLDLGAGKNRLGGSVLAQLDDQLGDDCPDVDNPAQLTAFFGLIQAANRAGLLLAYHDRSDGGLFTTLAEMTFASRCGATITLPADADPVAMLFSEELGAVVQIRTADRAAFTALLDEYDLAAISQPVGTPSTDDTIRIQQDGKAVLVCARQAAQKAWSETTWQMQRLRDNPDCADQEYARIDDAADTGLFAQLSFDLEENLSAAFLGTKKPRVAVLREQGVNGQIEMAAAFDRAGFEAIDVTMSDLIAGRQKLDDFHGFVACGGFSFGDVLGAGLGWAKSIRFNPAMREQFASYLQRDDRFALGVCNGCQMLAGLSDLIPGAENWPRFVRNQSEQFEARTVMVEVVDSPSIFFTGMAGSMLPVAVAHGEGRAFYAAPPSTTPAITPTVTMRYVDHAGQPTEYYPLNPNGSPDGVTGLTAADGRVSIMMPHPERTQRRINHSWAPADWGELSPWARMFENARKWVG